MASSKANLGRPKGAKLEGLKQVASCRIKEMTGPKSKHKANKWLLPILAFCSMLGVVFSIGGITLAAYINALKIENEVKVDFSDLGQYFYSVTGNTDTGRTILIQEGGSQSATEQLINLQKIVAIGLINSNDTIELGGDIDWDQNYELNPIGSDDAPFNATFNGRGYIVNDLRVRGDAGRDVGMFGYTSVSSEVKNLILNHPTITVGDDAPSATASSSPFESYFYDAATALPDVTTDTFNNAGSGLKANNPETGRAIVTGFPANVYATINGAQSPTPTPIIYETETPEYISIDNSNPDSITITCLGTNETDSNENLYPGTVTAKVKYVIGDEFGYYVLERYQINMDENGHIVESTTDINIGNDQTVTVSTGIFKTIHHQYQEHEVNTGFFIGHCDGKANHLGLYGGNGNDSGQNGTIIVEGRQTTVYSARCLIGKTRMDNPVDASAGSEMQIIYNFAGRGNKDFGNPNGGYNMRVHDIEYGHDHQFKGYGAGSTNDGNQAMYDEESGIDYTTNPYAQVIDDVEEQYNNSQTLTSQLIGSEVMRTYSRYYPGIDNAIREKGPDSNATFPVTTKWETVKPSDAEENDIGFNAQLINGGLGAGTSTMIDHGTRDGWFGTYNYYYRVTRGIYANNAFTLWATKELSPYFGGNAFSVNFNITYMATGSNNNSFRFLLNAYNPQVKGQDGVIIGILDGPEDWISSHAQWLLWQDLSDTYSVDFSSHSSMYDPSLEANKIIADGKLHETTVSFEIDQTNGTAIGNLWNSIFNSDTEIEVRYPLLALGMGDTDGKMQYYADVFVNEPQYREGPQWKEKRLFDSDVNPMTQTSGNNATPVSQWIVTPPTSWIGNLQRGYQAFDYEGTGDNTFNVGKDYYDSNEIGYFNSYFEMDGETQLYIKDLTVTFTNRVGNTEQIVYNVDYIVDGQNVRDQSLYDYDQSIDNWTNWPTSSNVQIAFDITNNGSNTFRFYRNNNGVYGTYEDSAYPLVNDSTFMGEEANLGQWQP